MVLKGRHRKGWGQHFLVDSKIRKRVAEEAELSPLDLVVEIGIGGGFLTEILLQQAGWVVGFEIDSGLTPLIREKFAAYSNFSFYPEDFLKIDLQTYLAFLTFPVIKCVSNLPYSVSTPILFKLFDEKVEWNLLLLMVQREFGDKVLSFPPSGKGSLVSLATHLRFNVKRVLTVAPSAFSPIPKVESVVLKLVPRMDGVDLTTYRKVINLARFLFMQRRKSLYSRLEEKMGSRKKASDVLEKTGILPQIRADDLERSQWIALTMALENQNEEER
ncbi:MAG: 16S rRNA (adenine(1518)-N(6)/adenine(1519)-N(6))-dimethyltransferase RsmA [Atribacterota bacterium]